METMGESFHRRVAAGFEAFASPDWQRDHPESGAIVQIDATGSERDVSARVHSELAARWPGTFPALPASDI
jgi:hypothetical protein